MLLQHLHDSSILKIPMYRINQPLFRGGDSPVNPAAFVEICHMFFSPRKWGKRHSKPQGPDPVSDHGSRRSPDIIRGRFTHECIEKVKALDRTGRKTDFINVETVIG